MKNNLIIFVLLVLIISSCKKDDTNELPAATSNGANTLGCKINGVPWVADGSNGFQNPGPLSGGVTGLDTSHSNSGIPEYKKYFWLTGNKKDKSIISLMIGKAPNVGRYELNKTTHLALAWLTFENYGAYSTSKAGFMTDSITTGWINITAYNPATAMVSGTFEFKAKNTVTGEIINVTEGRFDRKP